MAVLIGMDEAGYGPNLGPLVVAATAWHVDDALVAPTQLASAARPNSRRSGGNRAVESPTHPGSMPGLSGFDLYHAFRDIVVRQPATDHRLAIADSKALYKPGGGLRQLERGVHAALLAVDRPASRWSALVELCQADPHGRCLELCWHDGFDCRLPVDADADEVTALGTQFAAACNTAGVRPLAIRARLVFPGEFNTLVEHHGTKGAALSHITVSLLRELLDTVFDGEPASAGVRLTFALCDKHGGRNHYAALLQHHFPEHWIEPLLECRAESRYHWGPPEAPVEVAFCVGGEAFLPTALASMTAKYLRELSMRAFNEFWCARIPNLRPTAGYPTDARRFKREIITAQRELNIDDHILWRNR